MSIRKRHWVTRGGETKEAWAVDYLDAMGNRRLKTLKTKTDATEFQKHTDAIRSGLLPEPVSWRHRPVEFAVLLPDGKWRGDGRDTLISALRSACPMPEPSVENIVLHIVAEWPPRSTIADVDNILKPIIDALTGVAWIDDTQICELQVRRVPGRVRQLHIKIWHVPPGVTLARLSAMRELGRFLGHFES